MKKYFLFIIFVFFYFSQIASADAVSRFVFTTPVQTIKPEELSQAITIQSQNAAGVAVQIPETFDLTFTSSSPTGQFVSSSGKTATKTMSKNTANRTVYYKDNSAGDFVLTLTAIGRTSKTTFTANQHIFIGVPEIKKPIATSTPISTHVEVSRPIRQVQKPMEKVIPVPEKPIVESTSTENYAQDASNVATVFEAPAQKSFASSIFSWPISIFSWIGHFFVGE